MLHTNALSCIRCPNLGILHECSWHQGYDLVPVQGLLYISCGKNECCLWAFSIVWVLLMAPPSPPMCDQWLPCFVVLLTFVWTQIAFQHVLCTVFCPFLIIFKDIQLEIISFYLHRKGGYHRHLYNNVSSSLCVFFLLFSYLHILRKEWYLHRHYKGILLCRKLTVVRCVIDPSLKTIFLLNEISIDLWLNLL